MLRVIFCDDDKIQLGVMTDFTRRWADMQGLDIEISQFKSGTELLERFQPQKNDILIMDIIMPGKLNGIAVAKKLCSQRADFHIIFMSSSEDFALEAYDVNPYSYLVKPVTYTAYSRLLDKLIQKVHQQVLSVQSGHEIYNLPIMDICFVEATNRQVVFSMKDGRSIATRETLQNIQEVLLKYPVFFKPHRSYIINMQHVDHFNSKEIAMRNSTALVPIARGVDKKFKCQYFKFMFAE